MTKLEKTNDKYESLQNQGKYKELLELSQENEDTEAKYWEITALCFLGRIEESLAICLKYEPFFFEDFWKRKYIYRLGILQMSINNLDVGRDYIEQSLEIANKLGNPKETWECLHALSLFYRETGELNKALEYNEKGIKILSTVDDKFRLAYSLRFKGRILLNRGELDQALLHFEKVYNIHFELGNQSMIAYFLVDISKIHFLKGEFEKAKECLEKAYSIAIKIGDYFDMIAQILAELIKIELKIDRNKAKTYLDSMKDILKQVEYLDPIFEYQYCEALYFKSSKRNRDKAKSEPIFEEIIKTDNMNRDIKIHSILHLIELLLLEYQSLREEVVLEDINKYLSLLYKLSTEDKRYPFIIRCMILQAQLSEVEGKFEMAEAILEEALIIAKEKNQNFLFEEIMELKAQMIIEFQEIKELMDNNASLNQRVEKSNMMEYLKKAQMMALQNDISMDRTQIDQR